MKRAAVDKRLAALADPQRRRAIELLSERPRRAGELARALKLSPPAMSRHLRALKKSGLVEETHPEFDARVRVYALKQAGLADLRKWLDNMELLWTRQLSSFKAHIEKGGPKNG
ncbi:MAG TPA: metalloregulator ArsR/SmtB family transcription factor [Parvularculaceae bacterium]|nr:metalloregulator ArsR/SmtB family transcription factor [Parvularculaceae bacterium]